MSSTFSGIELGKRALIANTEAMQTVGHNLANVNTEGYSRQRVEFKEMDPLDDPALNRTERPGQVGQGVVVAEVVRVRDELLDKQIVAQSGSEGYWKTRSQYLSFLEKAQNEPTDVSVRHRLDMFWSSWQDLSQHPEQMAMRKAVLERGQGLVDSIHQQYKSLKHIAVMINDDVQGTVTQVNDYLRQIAKLNVQIEKVQAQGDHPNDLLDRRDLLVGKLAELVPITTVNKRDPQEFQIHMGGIHLVQGKIVSPLETVGDPTNEGYWKIIRPDTKETVNIPGGKLGALIELRDKDTRGQIQRLDEMTANFADLVNEVHREGYGLAGTTGQDFFVQQPMVLNRDGSYDRKGTGVFDSTYIFRIDGDHKLNPQALIGLAGQLTLPGPNGLVKVAYHPADTVQDVINRINDSGLEISARLDRDGQLSFKAVPSANPENPDFVIRHIEDSGQLLVGYAGVLAASGPQGAYDWNNPQAVSVLAGGTGVPTGTNPTGKGATFAVAPLTHPAAWISINKTLVADPGKIAAGLGSNGQVAAGGDGSAALAIAQIRNTVVMIGQARTFGDYFEESVASIGLKGQTAQISMETQQDIMKNLRDTRDSISGVNIDEEMSNLLKFQHGYQASARFISTWNDMLDTIIRHMGV
ncbi:MAG: flagellar hook-associated protein FlgK [Spirochaetales bacterium]|nr:flagellar hook-associated protein FlgK [Spirochaetales bacterium]